jgi:hypothetical protein
MVGWLEFDTLIPSLSNLIAVVRTHSRWGVGLRLESSRP